MRFYQKYDYDNNFSNISIAKHRTIPQNAPVKCFNNISEAGSWQDTAANFNYTTYTNPNEIDGKTYDIRYVKDSWHYHMRGGYYSAVSFMDSQFQQIIDGLHQYNLWDTTVVM